MWIWRLYVWTISVDFLVSFPEDDDYFDYISNRNRGAKPKCQGRFSATAVILVTILVVGFPGQCVFASPFKAGEYPLVRSRWPGVSDDPIIHYHSLMISSDFPYIAAICRSFSVV